MRITSASHQWVYSAMGCAAIAVSMASAPVHAGWPPPGVPSGTMPWEFGKYPGYQEPPHPTGEVPSPSAVISRSPLKYTIQVTRLPQKHEYEDPTTALMIAHVPEDAQIFFQDQPTTQTGMMRQFLSPSLASGSKYHYMVRVRWHENGKWVEQMISFPIQPGEVHCIDIVPSNAEGVAKETKANLAKLSPEDRKLADEQKFCAVQTGIRLGSMGVPVKVMANGKPVLLCCSACEDAVRKNPGEISANVEKLKGKK